MRQDVRLLCIVGPTAVGKTKTAVLAARRLDVEIVSADSVQVYRGMDIGSAKAPPQERGGVPHHLLDVLDPDEPMSVARFQAMARAAVEAVWARGKLPLLVGGTGLYVRAVVRDYRFTGEGADPALRARLAREDPAVLHARLSQVDPAGAAAIPPANVRRVIRALEFFLTTGRPISGQGGQERAYYDYLMVGLTMERQALYRRIDERVDAMMAAGFLDEVRRLLEQYGPFAPSMQAIGYKEMADHLLGRTSLAGAVDAFKRETRRYAKRQLTWFRREPRIQWIDVGEANSELAAVEKIVSLVAGSWSGTAEFPR